MYNSTLNLIRMSIIETNVFCIFLFFTQEKEHKEQPPLWIREYFVVFHGIDMQCDLL